MQLNYELTIKYVYYLIMIVLIQTSFFFFLSMNLFIYLEHFFFFFLMWYQKMYRFLISSWLFIFPPRKKNLKKITSSRQGLEYTGCIPCRGLNIFYRSPQKKQGLFWVLHKTAPRSEAPVLEFWGACSTLWLAFFSGPLWPRMVVLVRNLPIGQIDKNIAIKYEYLKLYCCI